MLAIGGVALRRAVETDTFERALTQSGGRIDANAALRLVSHVALTSTVSEMRWRSHGDSYWYRPVTIDIQFN